MACFYLILEKSYCEFCHFQRPEEHADERMAAEDPSETSEVKTAERESQMDTFAPSVWTTVEGKHQHNINILKASQDKPQ